MKIYTVTMPDIGEGVVEGEVIEWLKKVGDPLKQDEPVVVVMTDKATVELPAPTPGKLARQHYQPGQMAQRDKPLYDIEVEESIPLPEKPKEAPLPTQTKVLASKETSSDQILAIPSVRKLARDLKIDLAAIKGSGPEGRITLEDFKQLQERDRPEGRTSVRPAESIPLIGIRHQMAKKMKESHEAIPPFSYFEQADATRLIQLKENIKKEAHKENIRVTFMPLFIKALSLTLKKYPQVNSSYDEPNHRLLLHKHHNVGIAIATKEGLIVPVLKNVEQLTLTEVIRHYADLKQKALEGKLQPHEMREATITISNYGVLGGGGLWATPIINSPEVAILAVARIQKQPFVKNGALTACDLLNVSWSFDHRVIDGDLAASFSHHFCSLIQNPASIL